MQNIFHYLPAIAVSLDQHDNILAMSEQFSLWTKCTPHLGDNLAELLYPDLYLSLKEFIRLANSGHACQCSVTYSQSQVEQCYQVALNPSDTGCVLLAQECKQSLHAVESNKIQDFLKVTCDAMDQGIAIFDQSLQLMVWNRRFEVMGIFPRQIVAYGLKLLDGYRSMASSGLFGPGDPERLAQERIDKVCTLQMNTIEDFNLLSGSIVQIHQYYLSGGGMCTVLTDVTEQRKLEDSLTYQASHDFLTGAFNRRYMLSHLEALVQNQTQAFYILFIDLDRFKLINDIFGHETGDELLIACAGRINLLIDPEQGDVLARFGGDEFLLLIKSRQVLSDIVCLLETLQEVVAQTYIIHHRRVFCSVCIGISQFPQDGQNSQELIGKADMAMFHAKLRSRNNFRFYNTKLGEILKRNALLINTMREDILSGEAFALQYQPIISLQNGELVAAEALLRWNTKNMGEISPSEFIPHAEDSQQIHLLGLFVIDQGLFFLNRVNQTFPHFHLAMNVSPLQLGQSDFSTVLKSYIDKHNIDPQNLTIEITESSIMLDMDEVKENLFELRRLGCGLAIDDFGSGYSSLSYIHKFPFTHIKIDQNFIQQIFEDSEHALLVKAIIDMAKAFSLKIVAEGIESKYQLKFLQDHGCTFAQGFYIDRPLTEAELINRLAYTSHSSNYRSK